MVQSNKIILILRPSYSSVSVLSLCLSIMKSWKKVFFWQLQACGSVLVYGCETLNWRGWIRTRDLKKRYFVSTKMYVLFSTEEKHLEIWLNLFTLRTFGLKNITDFRPFFCFSIVKFYILACLWTEKYRGRLNLACRIYLNAWDL